MGLGPQTHSFAFGDPVPPMSRRAILALLSRARCP